MGEIVPGNGKYGLAGFLATERAMRFVLLFACVAVVVTCAFLVWRDLEPVPAESGTASRSVTVELDLSRRPEAAPASASPSPQALPAVAVVASPSPVSVARPVAVASAPASPAPAQPLAASPSPGPSTEPAHRDAPSPRPSAAPAAAPPRAGGKPAAASKGKSTRVVVEPRANAQGSRRSAPSVNTLRVPDVPFPGGTTPPSWQPPAPSQPSVASEPVYPRQPSYSAPAESGGSSFVTIIGQLVRPNQESGGNAVTDQVVLVNLGNFQSTRGSLGADGSFTFTNLLPHTRYCLTAWHHARTVAGVGASNQGGAFQAKLSWHQAIVAPRSGTYSVSLTPQNADPFYCVDQLLPNDLPGRQSSLRPADLQPIQRQGYR